MDQIIHTYEYFVACQTMCWVVKTRRNTVRDQFFTRSSACTCTAEKRSAARCAVSGSQCPLSTTPRQVDFSFLHRGGVQCPLVVQTAVCAPYGVSEGVRWSRSNPRNVIRTRGRFGAPRTRTQKALRVSDFHYTEAACNARWSIGRLPEHRIISVKVWGGQDPTRSM